MQLLIKDEDELNFLQGLLYKSREAKTEAFKVSRSFQGYNRMTEEDFGIPQLAELITRLGELGTEQSKEDKRAIRMARVYHAYDSDKEVEIDDDAIVSRDDDESNGCWVAAWVWVDDRED